MRLKLHALGAMPQINMFNLMSQHCGQLIFGGHQVQHSAADKNVATGKCKSVDEVGIGDVMKMVGKFSLRIKRNFSSYPLYISFNQPIIAVLGIFRFRRLDFSNIALRHLIANADLLLVADARQAGGHTAHLLLGIGDQA